MRPSFDPALMAPWVEAAEDDEDGIADPPVVLEAVTARKEGLAAWSIGEAELADYAARTCVRVLTPGSDAGAQLLVSLAGKSAPALGAGVSLDALGNGCRGCACSAEGVAANRCSLQPA